LDIVGAHELLGRYTPRASLLPPERSDPQMWPFSRQVQTCLPFPLFPFLLLALDAYESCLVLFVLVTNLFLLVTCVALPYKRRRI